MATTNNNNVTTKVNRYDVGSDDTSSSYENLAKTYNNSATNTNDYYKALNDESYKTMLNSEIQASQAKQQALKYTQNALQANGYSGQGVSESTMAGINSSYNNALSNAYSTYQGAINTNNVARQQALSDLDQNYYNALTSQQQYNYDKDYQERKFAYEQEQDALDRELAQQEKDTTAQTELYNSMLTDIGNASDTKSLQSVLDNYGVLDAETGELDKEALNAMNLTDTQKKSLMSNIDNYSNVASSSTNEDEYEDLVSQVNNGVTLSVSSINNNESLTDSQKEILTKAVCTKYGTTASTVNNDGDKDIVFPDGTSAEHHLDQALSVIRRNPGNVIKAENGTVLKCQGDFASSQYAYLIYYNGVWYQSDVESYNKSSSKYNVITSGINRAEAA